MFIGEYLDGVLGVIVYAIIGLVPFVLGGLIMHWAFGGKKENKEKNDKLFETTAYLNAVRPTMPRKLR